jgi:hypothetical protein
LSISTSGISVHDTDISDFVSEQGIKRRVARIAKRSRDQGGQLLEGESTAIHVADLLAQELTSNRPELRGKRYKVLVTDADGEHIHEAPLDKFRLV